MPTNAPGLCERPSEFFRHSVYSKLVCKPACRQAGWQEKCSPTPSRAISTLLQSWVWGRSFVQDKNGNLRNSGPWKGPHPAFGGTAYHQLLVIIQYSKADILGSFQPFLSLSKDLPFLLCSHNIGLGFTARASKRGQALFRQVPGAYCLAGRPRGVLPKRRYKF